jgi:hypothetical protein
MIRDRLAIIKKSSRGITATAAPSDTNGEVKKKREKKGERKSKIVAGLLDEFINEEGSN